MQTCLHIQLTVGATEDEDMRKPHSALQRCSHRGQSRPACSPASRCARTCECADELEGGQLAFSEHARAACNVQAVPGRSICIHDRKERCDRSACAQDGGEAMTSELHTHIIRCKHAQGPADQAQECAASHACFTCVHAGSGKCACS